LTSLARVVSFPIELRSKLLCSAMARFSSTQSPFLIQNQFSPSRHSRSLYRVSPICKYITGGLSFLSINTNYMISALDLLSKQINVKIASSHRLLSKNLRVKFVKTYYTEASSGWVCGLNELISLGIFESCLFVLDILQVELQLSFIRVYQVSCS